MIRLIFQFLIISNQKKMLNQVINKKYLIDGQKISLVQLWGSNFEQRTFNPLTLLLKFNKSLNFNSSISTGRKTNFHY